MASSCTDEERYTKTGKDLSPAFIQLHKMLISEACLFLFMIWRNLELHEAQVVLHFSGINFRDLRDPYLLQALLDHTVHIYSIPILKMSLESHTKVLIHLRLEFILNGGDSRDPLKKLMAQFISLLFLVIFQHCDLKEACSTMRNVYWHLSEWPLSRHQPAT